MTPSSALRPYAPVMLRYRHGRGNEVFCLILSDWAALLMAVVLSVACKQLLTVTLSPQDYIRFWPFLFVFIAVYAAAGLYSGLALNPVEEIRRASLSSAIVFVVLGAEIGRAHV